MPSFFVPPTQSPARQSNFAAQALRRRLLELPIFDLEESTAQIIEEIRAFNYAALTRTTRLEGLEAIRLSVEPVITRIEAQLARAPSPAVGESRRLTDLMTRLLRELAAANIKTVLQKRSRLWGFGGKTALHVVLVHALDYTARRILFAYRDHGRAPRGAWVRMHELYGLAQKWKLAHREISAPRASAASIYRRALLLEFADPARLNGADLRRVHEYITKFGESARVLVQPVPSKREGVFIVDDHRDVAGRALAKHSDGTDAGNHVMLACNALLKGITRQLKALDAGTSPLELGLPGEASTPAYRELLRRLHDNWSGSRRTRSARVQFRPRIEVHTGLERVWRFLHGRGSLQRGGLRPEVGAPAETTDWVILNESAGGFALRHALGATPSVLIGEIVALRPLGRSEISVAVVRWIHSEHADHLDVGVQLLAPNLKPVMVASIGSLNTAFMRALLAPPFTPFNRVPVLITASRFVRLNRKLLVRSTEGEFEIQPQRMLDATHVVDIVQVVGPDSRT